MTIQMGYYLCTALGILAGMLIMALAVAERDDLDEDDNFDFWIDD